MRSIALLAVAATALCDPIVYMIRHGEKPDDDGIGLSPEGVQRAQCIRSVFGAASGYNIGHIMAQEYKENGKRKRPYDTVLPVANNLGLTVDVTCDRDDEKCVADAVHGYTGSGNILISWQHGRMNNIAEEIGAGHVKNYPGGRFDLIWTLPPPYKDIEVGISEECPGLDSWISCSLNQRCEHYVSLRLSNEEQQWFHTIGAMVVKRTFRLTAPQLPDESTADVERNHSSG